MRSGLPILFLAVFMSFEPFALEGEEENTVLLFRKIQPNLVELKALDGAIKTRKENRAKHFLSLIETQGALSGLRDNSPARPGLEKKLEENFHTLAITQLAIEEKRIEQDKLTEQVDKFKKVWIALRVKKIEKKYKLKDRPEKMNLVSESYEKMFEVVFKFFPDLLMTENGQKTFEILIEKTLINQLDFLD